MNFSNLIVVMLMTFLSKGEGLQAACSHDLAQLKGAPRNGELTLTTPTDRQLETVANMRKDQNEARRECDRARQNSLTNEQKEEKNTRTKVARQKKIIDERNAYKRQARKNVLPPSVFN
jgi:hypothetical protein